MFAVVNDITDKCPSGDQKKGKKRTTTDSSYSRYFKRPYSTAAMHIALEILQRKLTKL